MKSFLVITSGSLLLLAMTGAVNAADVGVVAPYTVTSYADGRTCTQENSLCLPNPAIGTGNASQSSQYGAGSATVDLSKAPSIGARAQADLAVGGVDATMIPRGIGGGEVRLKYQFRLVGPSSDVVVPFHFVSSGFVQITGDHSYANLNQLVGSANAYSSLEVDRENPTTSATTLIKQELRVDQLNIDATGQASRTFSLDQIINMNTESVFDVTMHVTATASTDPNSPGAVFGGLVSLASLDPYLYIDPAYADIYKDYSVVFSGGIVNSLTPIETPIPAAAPLFAAALMTLGARLPRKRRGMSTEAAPV